MTRITNNKAESLMNFWGKEEFVECVKERKGTHKTRASIDHNNTVKDSPSPH